MIIRPRAGALLFITQPDHAAAAADLVLQFDGFAANLRKSDIHLAVREHDAGWQELDEEVVFDEASGAALDFMGVPEPFKRTVWPVGIDALADRAPYAAALIAEHALFVYSANVGNPGWAEFFKEIEERRTRLLARSGVPLDTLKADYPFLGIADLVSLSFCHLWTEPKERFGRSVRCEDGAVTIIPSVLTTAAVPVRVRARVLPDRRFDSREELRDRLARAPVEFLTGIARAGSAA